MQRATHTERYWRDTFRLTDEDREVLLEQFMAKAEPMDMNAIAQFLIEQRVLGEERAMSARRAANTYQPAASYEVGDSLVFPALDGTAGTVTAIRPGNNPRYEKFSVLQVEIEGESAPREFVADFRHPHALNMGDAMAGGEPLSVPEITERYGFYVRQRLEQEMAESHEFVRVGNRWLPTALMVEINEGHRNIADAMIDITGEPMATAELIKEIGVPGNVPRAIQEFSVNASLAQDRRFRNVGTNDNPKWALVRLG